VEVGGFTFLDKAVDPGLKADAVHQEGSYVFAFDLEDAVTLKDVGEDTIG
jgi:hypothetical protein